MATTSYKTNQGLIVFGLIIAALLVAAFFMLPSNMRFVPILVAISCWVPYISLCRRNRIL